MAYHKQNKTDKIHWKHMAVRNLGKITEDLEPEWCIS